MEPNPCANKTVHEGFIDAILVCSPVPIEGENLRRGTHADTCGRQTNRLNLAALGSVERSSFRPLRSLSLAITACLAVLLYSPRKLCAKAPASTSAICTSMTSCDRTASTEVMRS